MEFRINSKVLEKLLAKVYPVVPARTPMPILENFLFDISAGNLTVCATDHEISMKASSPITADGEAKLVIPARLIYEMVRSFNETSALFKVEENGKISVTTDNGHYSISYLPVDQYPEIPSLPAGAAGDDSSITLNGMELKRALDSAAFAMSKEDMRPSMMGTLFDFVDDGLRFVATDGHRLVNLLKKNVKFSKTEKYIIPERAISVLQKILEDKEVVITISQSHMSFRINGLEFTTRLIGQRYPDYQSVIPMENEGRLHINATELLSAVKRMILFSPTNSRKVKFALKSANLEVSAEDSDQGSSGKETIPCDYSGNEFEIGFNAQYVADILTHLLSHMDGKNEIVFKLNSPTKAVLICPVEDKENEELLMLLMPVRLNS